MLPMHPNPEVCHSSIPVLGSLYSTFLNPSWPTEISAISPALDVHKTLLVHLIANLQDSLLEGFSIGF